MLHLVLFFFFFFNDTATTEIYTLSLHDALPISLDLNYIWLQNFSPDTSAGGRLDMKFAHLVVAKGYIGCLTSSSSTDTAPPSVSITAPAAGSTVSGSTVTVTANATDDVGVVGLQFKLRSEE